MSEIDLSDSNHEIARQIVEVAFSSEEPQQTTVNVIHAMIDHPWLDGEMRCEIIQAAATVIDLSIRAEE